MMCLSCVGSIAGSGGARASQVVEEIEESSLSEGAPERKELIKSSGLEHEKGVDLRGAVRWVHGDDFSADEGLPVSRGSALGEADPLEESELNAVPVAQAVPEGVLDGVGLGEGCALGVRHLPDKGEVLPVLAGLKVEGARSAAKDVARGRKGRERGSAGKKWVGTRDERRGAGGGGLTSS